jgi:hypothetical protein
MGDRTNAISPFMGLTFQMHPEDQEALKGKVGCGKTGRGLNKGLENNTGALPFRVLREGLLEEVVPGTSDSCL